MKLRAFLDAAFALFVDEYQRMGMGLMEALDNMAQWAQGDGLPSETPTVSGSTADSLSQLNAMMKDIR